MSNQMYNQLWIKAQSILNEVVELDQNQICQKPSQDKKFVRKQVCGLFVKYILTIKQFCEVYDQLVHPQKRILIKKILDLCIVRYLEIKQDLVNLDCTEFTNFDDVLQEMGVLISDIDGAPMLPDSYFFEKIPNISWKNDFIDRVLKKNELELVDEAEGSKKSNDLAKSQTDLVIQKSPKIQRRVEKDDDEVGAAITIQRTWRGWRARRNIRKGVLDEMLLIGMLPPENFPKTERMLAEEIRQKRYRLQQEHTRDYEAALLDEKKYIEEHTSNLIKQEIKDEVRKWYMSYKQHTGKFPEIPPQESGGSAVILKRYTPIITRTRSEASKSQSTLRTSGTSKASKTKKSVPMPQDEILKSRSDIDDGFKITSSNILSDLIALCTEYEDIWKYMDERNNPEQTYVREIIQTEKYYEVQSELRKAVDMELRAELEELQAALDRDIKGKKGKKCIKKKKAKRSMKKGKRKDKDLTAERHLESLFEELISNGIIRKYSKVRLSAFEGEISCSELKNSTIYSSPSLGDVRQVIRDYCILPLSSEMIHQSAPVNKSLLIVGPSGSGKNLLMNAICTEVGATLFDLSASNIVGKYPGRTGLVMLIHLVNKVSKLLQPAIIYINNAEKMFLKKVPKTDKTDPKRLKKDILRIVKAIGLNDQVMLIGVTYSPFECDQKSLFQTYGKIILMIKPDYPSIYSFWDKLIRRYNTRLNVSILAKLCDGYTIGTILRAVDKVMGNDEIHQLKTCTLDLDKIIDTLAKFDPVYKEEEDAFMQWYLKTPIGKSKQRCLDFENELNQTNENVTVLI